MWRSPSQRFHAFAAYSYNADDYGFPYSNVTGMLDWMAPVVFLGATRSAQEQGSYAATTALKILDGTPPDQYEDSQEAGYPGAEELFEDCHPHN